MVMLHSEAPHAFPKPLYLVCDFPNSWASWLCLTKPGAGESTVAKLATYHEYLCLCAYRSHTSDHPHIKFETNPESCIHTHIWHKSHDILTDQCSKYCILSHSRLLIQHFSFVIACLTLFHSVEWSCHTPYGDNLPLAIFDFATMLYITKPCLPGGFLTSKCHVLFDIMTA